MLNLLVLVAGALAGFTASRLLRRPERVADAASVGRTVGGTLGRRRGLTAPELQRACFSEMVRHVQVDRQGRTHAPARYVLLLHPDDVAVVDDARHWFLDGLVAALEQAASQHGWLVTGPVTIDIETTAARRPGVPGALAVTPGSDAAPAATAQDHRPPGPRGVGVRGGRALVVVRSDTGERFPLRAEPLTIGRAKDRDITIDDNRVSRAHARIEARNGGWTVVDDGSANGTRLRGQPLAPHQPRPLRAGDLIGIGPVELRVAAGSSGPAERAGTRALDDSDRTRISAEVLPRGRRPPR